LALLAEEIVEEWLNRQGYFTIRGIKLGVDEIDLLATKFLPNGEVECRHIEVQASMRPVSYISQVPKKIQKTGKAANSASRTNDELVVGVEEWVTKKFKKPKKVELLQKVFPQKWSSELVINVVKSTEEVELISGHGIKIIQLPEIIKSFEAKESFIKSASGADFIDLIQMGKNA
jgi:hypothetical protein